MKSNRRGACDSVAARLRGGSGKVKNSNALAKGAHGKQSVNFAHTGVRLVLVALRT
jgi:hypothetical protein